MKFNKNEFGWKEKVSVNTNNSDKLDKVEFERMNLYNISSSESLIIQGYPLDMATYREDISNGDVYNKRYINVDKNISNIIDTNKDIIVSIIYEENGKKKIFNKVGYYSSMDYFKNTIYLPINNSSISIQVTLFKNKQYNENLELIDSEKCSILLNFGKKDEDTVKLLDSFEYRISIRNENVLTKTNIKEYTPTKDYHPATKKYVDNKFVMNENIETIYTIPMDEMQKCNNGTGRYISNIDFDELFINHEKYIYYANYKDNTLIPVTYDSKYNRFVTDTLDKVGNFDIILAFDLGTHRMYPFSGGLAEIKAYVFTNDLIIKRVPILNVNEVATREYVDDSIANIEITGGSNINDTTASANTTYSSNKIESIKEDLSSQIKEIENYSLVKHTDGKVYIKKQDGTLIGTGVEVGSNADLSKVTMSMDGQTLKLLNDGTQIATVEIPTATVTDEQLTAIIQSKIDDGTLTALTIEDGSITPNKTDFLKEDVNNIISTNFTRYYDTTHGYFSGKGSYGTDWIDISRASKIKAYCGTTYVCWLSYKIDNTETILTLEKTNDYPYLFFDESMQLEDGNYLFECNLNAYKQMGATQIALGFWGKDFNGDVIQIELINDDTSNKKELSIAPSYGLKISNDNIDNDSIDFEKINIYKSNKVIDFRKQKGTGFNNFLATTYGSNKKLYGGFIDVSINKTIYSKHCITNKTNTNYVPYRFGCYDADKNLLYVSSGFSANDVQDDTGVLGVPLSSAYVMEGLENIVDETIYGMCIQKIIFPEEVKYVVFSDSLSYDTGAYTDLNSKYFCIGFEPINDLYLTNDKYYKTINPNFKNIISEIAQIENTETGEAKRLACIGDSLTNWGGGDNVNDGFLKPIYDKLGISVTNLGLAGETWEIARPTDGSTTDITNVTGTSAIGRVNKIVSDNVAYDYILFFMGANTKDNGTLQSPSTDPYTMCGAMKYCLETIMRTYPRTIIGVILPPMRVEDSHDIEGKSTMETKGEMIRTIANYYSVPVFDAYHESQIVAGNVVVVEGKPNTGNGSLSDGLHLGEIGIYHLGRKLSNWVSML